MNSQKLKTTQNRMIHSVVDANSLHAIRALPRRVRVNLELPQLSAEQRGVLAGRLNRLLGECGCQTSACFLSVAMVLCASVDLAMLSAVMGNPLKTVAINLLGCFIAAGAGKALGILRAKGQLHLLITELEGRLLSAGAQNTASQLS